MSVIDRECIIQSTLHHTEGENLYIDTCTFFIRLNRYFLTRELHTIVHVNMFYVTNMVNLIGEQVSFIETELTQNVVEKLPHVDIILHIYMMKMYS